MDFNDDKLIDYDRLIDTENLLNSWRTYQQGKAKKMEVMEFERHLEDNLFSLHRELKSGNYRHSGYSYFRITDPKKRDIYKAIVKDRIIHQALYEYLCKIYEPLFTIFSFSSRKGKGTHRAVSILKKQSDKMKRNEKKCWAAKCDIRKYFENIDHKIILEILKKEVKDEKIFQLLEIIVGSFGGQIGKGAPLGNITSQIFANIYLNELDKFVENELELKGRYVRYNDDFIIISSNRPELFSKAEKIKTFLKEKLQLELPPEKTIFRKLRWGIDFCGSVILDNGILLRNKTKGKMFDKIKTTENKLKTRKISQSDFRKILDSYFGLLSHCKAYSLKNKIKNEYFYNDFSK